MSVDFESLEVGDRLLVTFNRKERPGTFVALGNGSDEGKVRVKLDDDDKEYREIKYENVVGLEGEGAEEPAPFEPVSTPKSSGVTYFIWGNHKPERRVIRLMGCEQKMTDKGAVKVRDGIQITVEFGLYECTDPEILGILKKHRYFDSPEIAKSFREATADEIKDIEFLKDKGQPHREILVRMYAMQKAASGALS